MPHTNTGHQPTTNSEMDMSGWFVPIVDVTNDDDDTNSHRSDIPLQLPASANVSSCDCVQDYAEVVARGSHSTCRNSCSLGYEGVEGRGCKDVNAPG